ncbi:ammonium transporter [Parachryseolinea silvisoli]|jgi:Amt family ammonium transporter|uniref:ammonium transporter n=1 Tax=Parachryseolinea silvisoli TaxID=2873601 RepID=UPI002265C8BC|nr:ammonium transporter [Parachryseolinea silvisoli]MCD9013946.1 ammonium transporter [Parachryseolinea silvisoli]
MKKSLIFLLLLVGFSVLAVFMPSPKQIVTEGLNGGDIAWMLAASAMVLLMTPGLAFFYGGMIDMKNIVYTMFQSFIAMGVVGVLWIVVGFSLAFGDSIGGIIGDPRSFFMFQNVMDGKPWALAPTIPLVLFAFFQLKFAIITPALITGTFAERVRFKSYIIFLVLFTLFIYSPLAHWTWHPDGFLFKMGVLDFAGGTVVHMSAGIAALVASIFLRSNAEKKHVQPANIPYVLLGTGLLWFGWFGFNAGSAMGANALAASAFATTNTASAAAGLAWILLDSVRGKKPSALGFCIGAVVGLVAITPAAGFVTIPSSLFIGTFASLVSNLMVHWKTTKTSLEDTLDVFPCHGVGGAVGMLMTGLLAHTAVNGANTTGNGLFFGETTLFLVHLKALAIVVGFVFVGSMVILKITDMISTLQINPHHAGKRPAEETADSEAMQSAELLTTN